jgi:hypothetical protein
MNSSTNKTKDTKLQNLLEIYNSMLTDLFEKLNIFAATEVVPHAQQQEIT